VNSITGPALCYSAALNVSFVLQVRRLREYQPVYGESVLLRCYVVIQKKRGDVNWISIISDVATAKFHDTRRLRSSFNILGIRT